jgi:hypothetical protein
VKCGELHSLAVKDTSEDVSSGVLIKPASEEVSGAFDVSRLSKRKGCINPLSLSSR